MQKSVLNKQGKFAVKILWRYTDMAIFVLRCFILTHPVYRRQKKHHLTEISKGKVTIL